MSAYGKNRDCPEWCGTKKCPPWAFSLRRSITGRLYCSGECYETEIPRRLEKEAKELRDWARRLMAKPTRRNRRRTP